jgi:hypothetical protein
MPYRRFSKWLTREMTGFSASFDEEKSDAAERLRVSITF